MYAGKDILIESQTVQRRWPANISEIDKSLFICEQNLRLQEVPLLHYKDVRVNGSGIIFSGFKIEKDSLIWDFHASVYNTLYIGKEYLKKRLRILGKQKIGFVCFDYWSDGYFHWLCEALPRIIAIERHLNLANAVLLLPSKYANSFHKETLNVFPDIKIDWISENEMVKCSTLFVPARLAPSGSNNPEFMRLLQKKIFLHFGNEQSPFRNIYVSRKKAKRRMIQNEEEVIILLTRYGFEIICYEDFSFEDQVKITQTAKNCVSIHGANLANILFMNKDSNVLEFRMKDDAANNYYYALAAACNVNYYYQLCDFSMISTDGNNFNIVVDITVLEKNIQMMLQKIANRI